MGYGYWTRDSFVNYSAARGRTVTADGCLDRNLTDQQIFTQRRLHAKLSPRGVMRECCDSKDHPHTIPVILALDVTGSMGPASAEVAKKMNEVMTRLYGRIPDVEFMVMGIGDLAYDRAPIQISQFEADIRIAEQLDLIYMEHGGGGNAYESYTAAWYMGLNHTRLDCWKRGERGLIITMGDEPMNPYLPREPLAAATGDALQGDVVTRQLYRETLEKYDLYHLHVRHRQPDHYLQRVQETFGSLLPADHLRVAGIEEIADMLIGIIIDHAKRNTVERVRWDTDAGAENPDAGEKPAGQAAAVIAWDTGEEAAKERNEVRPEQPQKRGLFRRIAW